MNAPLATVADLYVVQDDLALVGKAQEGIEAWYFENLLKHSGFRKNDLANLVGIDPKTVDNYRKSQKKFTRDAAEKLLKLHRLFALGDDLFGSTAEFTDWLAISSPGLNNQTPLSLLHSVSGIMEVEKQLLRLAHGYAA
ncbi:type II RES/Xre toxin-antitoxin system antitoxin [Adhaeribacter pallidiroseus]|uniref:Uncharacterized protein n=1 Tax=Adhaeribacter pallidiroseus TaxID=2072847 RepID=A0A369QUS4_9BACT|nr:antitoxin Xre/MbcA/ParS toxin-binding domain-containing protein [Adhaeribacter pallidiroseus]RDC66539.1 hypothetical protein AHMF7616_05170 [Adhaeribacter pallidiroseus]